MIETSELKTYYKTGMQTQFTGAHINIRKAVTRSLRSGAGKHLVKAVDGVSLKIERGKTLGLVGESGCGKTTFGRTLVGLIKPFSGSVFYDGTDITNFDSAKLKNYRRRVQIVFQYPFSSLNPRMKIFSTVSEGLIVHKISSGAGLRQRSLRLMEMVGLDPEFLDRYPHEFSGGQRQRIGIARALAVEPEFLICDEPVSSLDVTIQAQIINLLTGLQDKLGFGCLFISHDLRVIRHMSDEVAVMYLGRIVERAETEELYNNPLHPYTQLLLSSIPELSSEECAVPRIDTTEIKVPIEIAEEVSGCRFYPRCPEKGEECKKIIPDLTEIKGGHFVSCLRNVFVP